MSLLNSASLVVTPNGYKEGTLYSVIPNTTLGDMTVVRATTATRVNSAGLIELVPYNLVTYSEQFDNASWTKTNATITANVTTAPDGYINADELFFTASGGFHLIEQSVSLTSGTTYTQSYFVKDNGQNFVQIYTAGVMGTTDYVNFNLTNGSISDSLGITGEIVNYGNGWYRISATKTASSTGNGLLPIAGIPTATSVRRPSYTGSGQSIYLWGAQLVEGTLPKDYVRTETRLNIPRLDYSNGSCPSLLVEPQRTNLYNYSEPTANEGAAANITYESFSWAIGFDNCVVFGDNSALRYRYGSTVTSGTEYTLSAYILMDDNSEPVVSNNITNGDFSLNIGNTVVVGTNNPNVSMGNNIWRVSKTSVASASSSNNGIIKYTGQSSKSFRVVGWQMEVGSYATSYIPTSGSTVTRNADAIYKTGISSLINSTEGVLYAEISALANDLTYKRISIGTSDNLFADNVGLRFNDTGTSVTYQFRVGNVYQAELTSTINQTDVNKLACVWKVNRFELWLNGVKVAEDTSGSVPSANTLNSVFYGKTSTTLAEPLYSNTKSLIVFPSALSDTELAQLTTL